MTPDLYGTWLEAGDNLQPIGDWIVRNWPNLAVALALIAFAVWAIRWGLRDDDRNTAWQHDCLKEWPHDRQELLDTCNTILAATNARKEDR